ncbi:MAG: M23 family metallopeptidase [Alphaproteobacteria bacterium]|nr:M23 family metallopeptidase [Alphaproteobacteria bacterium]
MGQESKNGWLFKPRTIALGLAIAVAVPATAFVSGFFAGQSAAVPPSEIDIQVDGFAQVLTLASWEAETEPQPPAPITRVVAVESGDNLMGVLIRAGAERTVAHAAIQSLKGSYDPRRDLNVGDELQITFGPGTIRSVENAETEAEDNPNYVLARLTIPVSYDKLIDVSRNEEGEYNANEVERPLTREVVTASGQIESSLFVAARDAGIPARVLAELIRIYSFDIDFQRDIWQGDKFELMFEQFRGENGDVVHEGEIFYAKLTLRDTETPLYRYETTAGNLDYFNSKGNSVRKTLMRTPVDGARLSSRFGKRKHPILGYTRMHAGVDFAAPTGTPIYAAGNGTIVQAGRNGGYGNYIRIRHNGTFQTAYAHLSKFARKTRKGARVKQGQVIGYIGTTGRSTGPHLHYEVLRNGRQINPRSVRIPSGEKLKGAELKKFIAMRDARDVEYTQLRDAGTRLVENSADEQ